MSVTSGWKKLVELLNESESKAEIDQFLNFILTDEEKVQLAKRVLLTNYLLFSNKTQRKIAEELGVSLTTITRCSNLLKHTPDEMKERFDFDTKK